MKRQFIKKMIKFLLAIIIVFSIGSSSSITKVSAEEVTVKNVSGVNGSVYQYNQVSKNSADTRGFSAVPLYFIYPDEKVDKEEAEKLLGELGIVDHIEEYASVAYIINPVNDTYDEAADKELYLQMLDYIANINRAGFKENNSNIKVIGIGDGATFVNDVISLNSWCVAGIMTYGGTKNDVTENDIPVPAYLHGQNETTIQYYVEMNKAVKKDSNDGFDTYVNEANELQKVVVSKKDDQEETLAQAFDNAWKYVFSKNYRMNNRDGEFYKIGFTTIREPYDLIPYVMYDDLNMTCDNVTGLITEDATEQKPNQWYQYFPKDLDTKEESSVPLVILLHGNTEDNKVAAETSGWIEKASQEGFACVAPEWQANGYYFSGNRYTRLYEEGTMDLIDYLVEKYPQLDASRVYLTGISAGGKRAEEWGITNTKKIAAVEATAARERYAIVQSAIDNKEEGIYLPLYIMGGTNDSIVVCPVNPSDVVNNEQTPYHSIMAYCYINDIEIPKMPDLRVNKYYGLALDNQGTYMYNNQQVYAGTLSNDVGVMLKAVTLEPYSHWNSKDMVDDVWDFFKNYARDLETGELIIVKNDQNLTDKPPIGDVDMESWQYPGAKFVYDRGIMTGTGIDADGNTIFNPAMALSREQFAQILYSEEGKPAMEYAENFKDVPEGKWYTNAILWATKVGIASGYGDKIYGVGDPITREQLALMLYKYAEYKGYDITARADISGFEDVDKIDSWAVEQLRWAVSNGVMKGSGTELNPLGQATRAEGATMIRSFIMKFGE